MNASRDYQTAYAQAQANANQTGQPWVIHGYADRWWINRLTGYGYLPPGAEVINPEPLPLPAAEEQAS